MDPHYFTGELEYKKRLLGKKSGKLNLITKYIFKKRLNCQFIEKINKSVIMTRAEVGKGGRRRDTINLFNVVSCAENCALRTGKGQFRCIKYNGDAVVIVTGGITRETLPYFISIAPCVNEN